MMDQSHIAELLYPFQGESTDERLTTNDLHLISTYIDLLLRWNKRINLTAIRDPEEIVTRHFGESLFAARHLFPRGGAAQSGRAALERHVTAPKESGALAPVADVGSGAGFPGLPVKLWAPQIELTLIESNHKKAIFLREVGRALTLTNVNVQNARAESLSASSFGTVTLRAVERFEAVLPAAAALVVPAGRLALLIGSAQLQQAYSTLPAFHWSDPLPIPNSRTRVLVIATQPLS